MRKRTTTPRTKSRLLTLLMAALLLAGLFCVQGCSQDDADNPLMPSPWMPVF